MRLVKSGLLLALACQGIYWLGVMLERGGEPLSLMGAVIVYGYGRGLLAMTGLALLLAAWGGLTTFRSRRSAS